MVARRHEPGSPEARAILAAHERLASKPGQTRRSAAARLLPQQSPESAARYIRKLRSGERTGRQIAHRPSIERRIRIFVPPARLGGILPPSGGPYPATVFVDTTCGPKAANAMLPYEMMTPAQFMAADGYAAWVAAVELRWSRVFGYACFIEGVTKIRMRSALALRAPFVRLRGREVAA